MCSASLKPLLNLGCGATFHPDWTNVDLAPSRPGILKQDFRKPLRFASESYEGVYHSHVLEHLPKKMAPVFLKVCSRVLRSGGVLRVVVPDLETIARLYLGYCEKAWLRDSGAAECHEWMTVELLDQMTRETSGGEMLRFWMRQPMPAAELVEARMGAEFRRAIAGCNKFDSRKKRSSGLWATLRFLRSGEAHRWMYDRVSLRQLLEETGFTAIRVCRADESHIPNFSSYHLDTDEGGCIRKPDSLFMEGTKL